MQVKCKIQFEFSTMNFKTFTMSDQPRQNSSLQYPYTIK